jgi:phosphopantothenoylcysteine synthetase/decarboxylase
MMDCMPTVGEAVLYVVACGGRPAADIPTFLKRMQTSGWHVCVIATPSALKFMDCDLIAAITGHKVRYDYKQSDEPDALPQPDAFVIAPATFNTVNKITCGVSDTLALGMLNEAIGMGKPIIAVPTPNVDLARHPAFQASVKALRSWGVNLMFDPTKWPLPTPNMGPPASALFPWEDLVVEATNLIDNLPVKNNPEASV